MWKQNYTFVLTLLIKMKKVLYISYDGMTDSLGQSQVLPYLSGLSDRGFEIHILSFEKPDMYAKRELQIRQIVDSSGIIWHPQEYTSSPPVLSTMKDVRVMKKMAMQLHSEVGFNMVHVRSYIAALAALTLKRKVGLPFVFDMRGLWADERVEGGLWSKKNPVFHLVYKYFKKKEKQFLNQSDAVVSLTHAAVPVLKEISCNKNLQVHVIPCCADVNHFHFDKISAEQKNAAASKLGIEKHHFVLSYLGSIGTWYMLDEMLDFFVVLKKEIHESVFLFVSHDSPEKIKKAALSKGIASESVRIIHATRDEVPLYISLSHLNIFFIKPVFSKTASSPTKMAEVLAMGVPVVRLYQNAHFLLFSVCLPQIP
jgi:glycosyltransferase involved in cell wall biosynthesis